MVPTDLKDHWPENFGLTYSVTLSTEGLETSLQVSNGGKKPWEFQVLLHTYLRVDVRSPQFLGSLVAGIRKTDAIYDHEN